MTEIDKDTTFSWRKFLGTPAGQKGMLYLRERVPAIRDAEQTSVIFNAGIVTGYNKAVDTISEILTLEIQKQVNLDNE